MVIKFILEEVKRQRKSYKKIAEQIGLDKDTLYRWQEGRGANIATVEKVLDVLGYDLVPLPKGRVDD